MPRHCNVQEQAPKPDKRTSGNPHSCTKRPRVTIPSRKDRAKYEQPNIGPLSRGPEPSLHSLPVWSIELIDGLIRHVKPHDYDETRKGDKQVADTRSLRAPTRIVDGICPWIIRIEWSSALWASAGGKPVQYISTIQAVRRTVLHIRRRRCTALLSLDHNVRTSGARRGRSLRSPPSAICYRSQNVSAAASALAMHTAMLLSSIPFRHPCRRPSNRALTTTTAVHPIEQMPNMLRLGA